MRRERASLTASGVAALVCATAATWVAYVWSGFGEEGVDRLLFDRGDGLFHVFVTDTVLRTGWFADAPRLGMPFGSSLLDFPLVEATNFACIGLLGTASRDPYVVLNLFLLLGFATTAASASWVLTRLGIRPSTAVAFGFAYALLPYHFLRFAHPFLAHYAVVPPYCALLLSIGLDATTERAPWKKVLVHGAALLVASGLGVYYAFFACMLLGAIGIRASIRRRSRAPLRRAFFAIAVLGLGVLLQLAPNLAHGATHGRNPSVAQRAAAESEIYALKPIELFLPSQQHRVAAMADVARTYADRTPLTNENATASQGVLLGLGLLVALAAFLFGRDDGDPERKEAGYLVTVGLLYASIGGLASVIAHLGAPGIRAVNRISVFLAFLAALVLARLVDRALAELALRRPHAAVAARALVVVAIVAAALVDEVPARAALPTVERATLSDDRTFGRRLESALPRGARVLVLPHVRFPEGIRRGAVDAYVPMRLVLATRDLRFSYGGMGSRPSDLWLRSIVRAPVERTITSAARAGFDAVAVFVEGYPSDSDVLSRLEAQLGPAIARSDDLVAFRIPRSLAHGTPMHVAYALHDGFLGWERFGDQGSGSWANGDATVMLVHPGARAVPVTISLILGSPHEREVTIRHGGRVLARTAIGALERVPVRFALDVPPGASVLTFTTDRPAALPGNGDVRAITFGVSNLRVSAEGGNSTDVPERP